MIEELTKIINQATTLVFVNFHGLTVAAATALRRSLRTEGVEYLVAKKTLINKALANHPTVKNLPDLPGEVAIAYGADQLQSAKGVYEFAKKYPTMLKISGGIFAGVWQDAAAMTALAAIPSREILYGQLVGLISSPLRGLVVVLNQLAKR